MKKIITLLSLTLFTLMFAAALPVTAQESFQPLKNCRSGNCIGIIRPVPEVIFVPQIIVAKHYKPITLQDLSIKTNIIGNVATTTYEMVMHNPNQATLEAEFVFPLAENQTVAAIALDINGKMREGVVVEKQKARETFEAVVRQGQDPLLVEKTADNQFKTRIYPFTPNGTRKIRITLEEPLQKENGSFKYVLPLNYQQKLDSFTLDIEIPTDATDLPEVTTDIADFHFNQSGQLIRSHFEAENYDLNNNLSFNIPQTETDLVFTHTQDGQTYFYGDIDVSTEPKIKKLPQTIAILWDMSLSGNKRNIEKEKELLTAYLQKIGNADIIFIPFNIEQGQAQSFKVSGGNATELFAAIDNIVYDGGTRFESLNLKDIKADEFLMFSDGVDTFGKSAEFALPQAPVYTISSAATYADGHLKNWAMKTFASFINLSNTTPQKALESLINQPVRIIRYNGNGISEMYPVIGSEVKENISFAGLLSTAQTDLEIAIGYDAENILQTKTVHISAGDDNSAVARLWATQKIDYLELDGERNKAEITALGQEYSIVTANTSLLVLENASDYLRYNITPPAELLNEYNRLRTEQELSETKKKQVALDNALEQARQVKEWWERKFDIKKIAKRKFEQLKRAAHNVFSAAGGEGTYNASFSDSIGHVNRASAVREMDGIGADAQMLAADIVSDEAIDMEAGHNFSKSMGSGTRRSAPAPKNTITIQPWDPDEPYLKILKASKDDELYADYLKLKIGYQDQPSFYFDITDEFLRRNLKKEALVVLSNITEMQIENVELLRIAANKLLQMEDYEHALDLFEKISELRGEHPQSFRDLALAYQAAGEYQKAFDTFRYILESEWQRFDQIKQIIFVELNNLLSLHPDVDTQGLNKEFIFAMPVDIRIVLSWSTDNTDIDLHVIDPREEECYYGHKSTEIGGRYPHDFTQGFGPEEFMLKRAIDGKYIIRTNNFGDHRQSISGATTLYLDLYTNYSRPDQKHERVFVRTENVKERNSIGEIVWEGSGAVVPQEDEEKK